MTQTSITTFQTTTDTGDDTTTDTSDENNAARIDVVLLAQDEEEFKEKAAEAIDTIPFQPGSNKPDVEKLTATAREQTGRIANYEDGDARVSIYGYLSEFGFTPTAHRDAVRELIDDAAHGDTTHILIHALDVIGRDIDSINDVIGTLLENDTILHTNRVELTPGDADVASGLLREISDVSPSVIDVHAADELVNTEEKHNGRPPLGFETDDSGRLQTAANYRNVCRTLQRVRDGDLSQRKAAKIINCAPRTIKRAIEKHPDRYQL